MLHGSFFEAFLAGMQEDCAAKVKEWMADDTVSANSTACVISALILTEEGSIPDALRACSAGTTLEMCAPPCHQLPYWL